MAKARVTSKSRNAKNGRKKGKSEFVVLKLRRDELELLKAKIHEVATEIALVEKQRAETRKTLARLDAT